MPLPALLAVAALAGAAALSGRAQAGPSTEHGSAARASSSPYPGPILRPGASVDEVADAWIALEAAIPSPVLRRAVLLVADASINGGAPPVSTNLSQGRPIPAAIMAPRIRAGQNPWAAPLLEAAPGAWTQAMKLYRAWQAKEARAEAAEEREAAYEAQAVDVQEVGPRGRWGKDVWMYHGTSSRFLPSILRGGILPGVSARRPRAKATGVRSNDAGPRGPAGAQPHVFLTSMFKYAKDYAETAARTHGGDPVVLRVIVPWDDLSPDPDDADLKSGARQWVISGVSPAQIYEVNGVRRRRAPGRA